MILDFHERSSREYRFGDEGLEAVRYLFDLLGQNWTENQRNPHPLHSKLMMAWESNYLWLSHFVRKLRSLQDIGGSESVIRRLAHAVEYAGALAELDFALKLNLSGIPVRFVTPTSEIQTSDLIAEIDGSPIRVEITSMNLRDEDRLGLDVHSRIHSKTFMSGAVGGGAIGVISNMKQVEELGASVGNAVDEAIESNKMTKVNVPGLATVYVAPKEKADEIPKEWRGSFRMRVRSQLPKKEKIIHKLKEKGKSNQLQGQGPGLLVIYDRYLATVEVKDLFEDPPDDVGIVLATFPVLTGLVLVAPSMPFQKLSEEAMSEEHRVCLEHTLPDAEGEYCVVWKNRCADLPFPEAISGALEAFPDNLSNLVTSSNS